MRLSKELMWALSSLSRTWRTQTGCSVIWRGHSAPQPLTAARWKEPVSIPTVWPWTACFVSVHATSIRCLQQFEAGPACALGQHPTQQAQTGPLGTRVTPVSTNTPLLQREMFLEGFGSLRCKLRLNTNINNWYLIAPREQRAFNSSERDHLCSEHRPSWFFWQRSLKKLKWTHLLFHSKKCDSNWLYQIPFKNEIICEAKVLTLR